MTKIITSLGFFTVLSASLGGCRSKSAGADGESEIAQVSIADLGSGTYDRYEVELISLDDPAYKFPVQKLKRGAGTIEVEVPAGTYKIRLDYFDNDRLTYGADLCSESKRDNKKTFVPGSNEVKVAICSRTGQPVSPAETGKSAATFTISGNKLLDPSGNVFVMRGLNMPHAYFADQSFKALANVKKLQFNTVRIVWCADTLEREGRCAKNHMFGPDKLAAILAEMRKNRLVAMLNLQNATGSNERADLQKMVDYLVKPEVVKVLMQYQDMLLINIANEWYGKWDQSPVYVDSYKAMIPQLRKAGLPHTLVIDARGYGQDVTSISEHGAALLEVDKNLLFSAHIYDVYGSAEKVKAAMDNLRNFKLPFIIGEFGCSHGARGPVACEAIMSESEQGDKVGTLAWSYTGNSSDLSDLDLFKASDWTTLTPYGDKIVNSTFGVKATSKEAAFFTSKTK